MRARRLCRLLLLAHLLALCAVPRLRAADGFAGLKPMVTLSFDSGARLLQSVGLGFEGAGFAAGDAWFRRQFAALLLVPALLSLRHPRLFLTGAFLLGLWWALLAAAMATVYWWLW